MTRQFVSPSKLDNQTKTNLAILEHLDQQVQEARRERLYEISQFRKAEQGLSKGRDFDLYDKASLRKQEPIRKGDFDPRLGPSSGQQFDGDDLGHQNREMLQKTQMKVWHQEQAYHKEMLRLRELEEKRLWHLI